MQEDLLALLQQKEPSLSKGQKKIARYLIRQSGQAIFQTASQLGNAVGVSESTVVRFAAELGFDGYPGLQNALRSRMLKPSEPKLPQESGTVGESLRRDLEQLRQTVELLDAHALEGAASALTAARRIYILGAMEAVPLAQLLQMRLESLLENVRLVTGDTGEMLARLSGLTAADAVIAISFSPYACATAAAAQACCDAGAAVIAITDAPDAPVAACGRFVLEAVWTQRMPLGVSVGALSIANALLARLSEKCPDQLQKRRADLARILAQYPAYEKQVDQHDI